MKVYRHGEKQEHPHKHEFNEELKVLLFTALAGIIFFGAIFLIFFV